MAYTPTHAFERQPCYNGAKLPINHTNLQNRGHQIRPLATPSLLLDDLGIIVQERQAIKDKRPNAAKQRRSRNTYTKTSLSVHGPRYNYKLALYPKKKGSYPEPLCMLNFGMKQFGGEIKSSPVVARVFSRP